MHRPKTVSDQLQISPGTLRLWSNHFAELLSPAAQKATTEQGTAAQRRYTDGDVGVLTRVKELLGQSLTYEEALAKLKEEPSPEPIEPSVNAPSNAVAIPSDIHIAMLSLREALASKDETIQAIQAHVDDLRAENERLRLELAKRDETPETLPEAVQSSQTHLSWWDRLLGRREA